MNRINSTALENKWPLNSFNFMAVKITNPMIPSNEMHNMHIVYHVFLHVHSVTCLSWTCSYSLTALIPTICCKSRLVTIVFKLSPYI